MLWQRRLRMARDASEYHGIFRRAGEACELPTQRDRRALLNLIDERVHNAQDVSLLLSTFRETPWAAKYLRNRILRRAFDPDQLLSNAPGETFWPAFRAGVLALKTLAEREKKLREFLEKNKGHVQARELLTELLFEENKNREAALEARRLRREGAASPKVLELLCDFEASENRVEAARRTCSELVEFNPEDPKAHERLGDIFLRRGWYAEAYRQYSGLVEMLNDVPYALLRLAAAAAGMGKVDEALRIERKVASGDGEPGPNDPRRIARMHSAARLAQLLLKAKSEGGADREAVARNLKRTQVLSPNTTAVFLVWEDYDVSLGLTATEGSPALSPVETASSPETGLLMLDLGRETVRLDTLQVRVQSLTPRRPVSYVLLLVSFDGKSYSVEQRTADILVQNS